MPPTTRSEITTYRTFVRISFEQEQQRSNPAAYWQLWKAGRRMNDSQKNDIKFRAIEYVGQDNPHMSIENTGLDGFWITWTINPNEKVHECSIPVRFNFLSTDFTLSKGVKGTSVRLCVKTKQLDEVPSQEPEVCYCNVKLFRDHGAERKLSNDMASIHKKIERLKMQMNEPAPPEPSRKRKRSSIANSKTDPSYSKDNLHGGGVSVGYEDNPRQINFQKQLQKRIDDLQKSIYTSRRESVLSLRAEENDDPEMYPSSAIESVIQQRDTMSRRNSSNNGSLSTISDPLEFNGLGTPNTMSSFQSRASTGSFKSERETMPGKISITSFAAESKKFRLTRMCEISCMLLCSIFQQRSIAK